MAENNNQQNYPSAYEQYNSAQTGAPAPQNNGYYGAPSYPGAQNTAGKGLGIASLVLGILAFLSGFALIGGLLGLIGLILGIVSVSKAKKAGAPKGMAITGIILSVLGLIFAIIATILVVTVFREVDFFGIIEACQHLQGDQAAFQQCFNDKVEENTGVTLEPAPTQNP